LTPHRPNILYIHTHDAGRYVQPFGFSIPTPNIQKLAEQGVFFRKAFSTAPQCSPSRAGLLTGQSPHSCGQLGLVNRGFELRDRKKHLAHTLKAAGYYTALIGCHHVVRDPKTCGYDLFIDTDARGYPLANVDTAVAAEACVFLSKKPKEPFFLSVGFGNPHRDYPELSDDAAGRYNQPPLPLPDTPETRKDMQAYKAAVKLFDTSLGAVINALDAFGYKDNTIVICTTDHGIGFCKMKCNLTDHGIGVMLIIRGPGPFLGGKVNDSLISQIDIYPTICELAAIQKPGWLQGKSIMPIIRGETDRTNQHIFAELTYHCSYQPMRAVRTERYKYIKRFYDYPHPMPCNVDNSITKDFMIKHNWHKQHLQKEELYDLITDPVESCNRAADPALADVLNDMRNRLETWMQQTQDPLLKGPIPLPDNAYASNPDDISPVDIWKRQPRPEGYA